MPVSESVPFPIEVLEPRGGVLSGSGGDAMIEIPLAPFQLDDLEVSTAIVLGGIELPTVELEELAGRRFSFPVNPEDGYIDGSVYIEHAHHPVDVTSIEFGNIAPRGLEAKLQMQFVFQHEGLREYANAEHVLTTLLSKANTWSAPPVPQSRAP